MEEWKSGGVEEDGMSGGMAGNKSRRLHLVLLPLILSSIPLLVQGCAYYSFTGASIPARLETIAIPLAIDESTSPLTGLEDELTEQLIQRFVQQTRLSLETDAPEADAVLSTRITSYRNDPIAVGGQERATLNRVSVNVYARYVDAVQDSVLLERLFTGTEEYDPVRDGLQGEAQAANAALDNIAQDIFNATTSDW